MALPSSPTCLSASPGKATTSLSPSPTPAMLQPSPPPWRRPSGQTFVGKLLAKTAEGHFEVIQRLYVPDEAVSMLTFENVIFEAPDVRQQLIAKVAVVSASWTGGVSLTSGHQGVPHGQVLAHRSVLMEAVGGCGGCGWPRKSISNTQRSSMPLTPSSSPSSLWVLVALSWMEQFSWIYLPENNLSTIPVDVVISKVSVRYQLAAQVSVVPAGWHLHFVSPGADRLAAGVGTAVAVTHMTSLVPIQTTWLPQGQACVTLTLPLPIHLPLHYIWNLVEYMYSDPSLMCLVVYPENLEIQENSVTKNVQMNVIGWLMAAPQVNPEITGLKYSKMSALEKLCLELKAAVTIRKEQSCNKSSKYFVKKVYVEGNLLHCSQENSGTHDRLQDPQRIGRHKFNLG
ncbi:uncharacterized protein LOC135097132 isoform X2 [Scylla paramamosain]|uniref:uncharacterized protein LOC135097132 isoform X2 n=1 Tax=Scylla paramamosain TaxID=85552 RepID=UPI003083176B